jgi:hypothetical protein
MGEICLVPSGPPQFKKVSDYQGLFFFDQRQNCFWIILNTCEVKILGSEIKVLTINHVR